MFTPTAETKNRIPLTPWMASSHPDVIAAWDKSQADLDACSEGIRQLVEEVGADRVSMYRSGDTRGLSRLGWDDPEKMPARWTVQGTPFKNNPLYERFESLHATLSLPGAPEVIFVNDVMVSRGVFREGGTVYITYGDRDLSAVGDINYADGDLWRSIPASEYWLAREAKAD